MTWKPDYASLADMRAFMRITDGTDTVDDARASLALTSASRVVDLATNRQFGSVTPVVARYWTPIWSEVYARYKANIDDVMSTAGMIVKADTDNDGVYETTITDYRLWPLNAAGDTFPWTEIVFGPTASVACYAGSLEVAALWGWTAIPDTIKEATLLEALRIYKRRDSPLGVAGSPDMGNELRLLSKLDPDVQVMLQPYVRWTMV